MMARALMGVLAFGVPTLLKTVLSISLVTKRRQQVEGLAIRRTYFGALSNTHAVPFCVGAVQQ